MSNLNLVMVSSATNVKSRGSFSLIVLFGVLLVAGGVLGFYIATSNKIKLPQKNSVGTSNSIAVDKTTPSVNKIITDAEIKWGSLVTASSSRFEIRGTVQAVENTKKKISDSREIEGMSLTIKNGAYTDKFFVSITADIYSGNVNDSSTWKKVKISDIKVGDKVDVSTSAPINSRTTIDSYVSSWVLINN